MPLREYQAKGEHNCPLCEEKFEHFTQGTKLLEYCPRCGGELRLVESSSFNAPEITKPVSITDAKKAGFTILKKISDREYEKQ